MKFVEIIYFQKRIEEDLKMAKLRRSSIFTMKLAISDGCVPFQSWLVKVAEREFIG